MKPVIKNRLLTDAGKSEFGYIFPDGYVPCQKNGTPVNATLKGSSESPEFVFLVDWASLTETQQSECLNFMSQKSGIDESAIKAAITADGYSPMRKKYLIESYDLRFFV